MLRKHTPAGSAASPQRRGLGSPQSALPACLPVQDYEGGEFLDDTGELVYRNKRQKRQQTAEDRIYGVFADNSGARCNHAGSQNAPPHTAPVVAVTF